MSIPFTILASVAGLTGSALVASVTQTLASAREPTHKIAIKNLSANKAESGKVYRCNVKTNWLSGSVPGQAHGWQSSGVPAVGSPKKPSAHCSQSSPLVLC